MTQSVPLSDAHALEDWAPPQGLGTIYWSLSHHTTSLQIPAALNYIAQQGALLCFLPEWKQWTVTTFSTLCHHTTNGSQTVGCFYVYKTFTSSSCGTLLLCSSIQMLQLGYI